MTPPDTVLNSALHWLKVGRFDQALPLFLDVLSKYEAMKQTSEVSNQVCRCRYLAAKAAAHLGLDAKAETLLKDAVQIAPEVHDTTIKAAVYFSYGEFLVEHGRNAEAIPQLQAALALNDYPSNGWRLLGIAFDETRQHEEAHRCFERALQSDPFNPQILFNLGVCLRYLKRFNESLDTLEQAINLAPVDAQDLKALAYNERGVVFEITDHYDKAEECYRMAIQLDPMYYGAPYNLADLLEKLGQEREALLYWQEAVALDPSDRGAAQRLARLRQKIGKM